MGDLYGLFVPLLFVTDEESCFNERSRDSLFLRSKGLHAHPPAHGLTAAVESRQSKQRRDHKGASTLAIELLEKLVGSTLQGAGDAADSVIVGMPDNAFGTGSMVELSERIGEKWQGIPARGLVNHAFDQARVNLNASSSRWALNDFR